MFANPDIRYPDIRIYRLSINFMASGNQKSEAFMSLMPSFHLPYPFLLCRSAVAAVPFCRSVAAVSADCMAVHLRTDIHPIRTEERIRRLFGRYGITETEFEWNSYTAVAEFVI